MAIRRLPSGSWQVYWNNPYTGRRETATEPTEHEARKKDALVKYKLQFERESFMPAETETPPAKLDSLEEVFKSYLTDKIHTVKGVKTQLDGMKTALKLYGSADVKDIGTRELEEIRDAEIKKRVKGVTVAARMRIVRTILRWANRRGYIAAVPVFPELPIARYAKLVPPTQAEISAMLDVAPDHIRRVIILGSQIGMRVGSSEMFRLRWQDIDVEGRAIVRVPCSLKNRSLVWREVPIREQLVPVFREWKRLDDVEGASYVVHFNGQPVRSIKRAWQTMLAQAGIERRIRPYDLRHAFATEMIAAGVDIGTVASLMGHSNPSMLLKHYQHVMTDQKVRAVEAMPMFTANVHAFKTAITYQ